jgi:hypothetical protein
MFNKVKTKYISDQKNSAVDEQKHCSTDVDNNLQVMSITNFYERDFSNHFRVLDDILVNSNVIVI